MTLFFSNSISEFDACCEIYPYSVLVLRNIATNNVHYYITSYSTLWFDITNLVECV